MDMHRISAAAAIPCLCLLAANKAEAQDRRAATAQPLAFELREPASPAAEDHRLQPLAQPALRRSTGMLESWSIAGAEVGVGRFGVGTIARARTNLERDRMMERENRNIAGAGMRLRF